MYSNWQLAKKYLNYYFNAFNGKGHGMHSPFVFDFILNVLNNKSRYSLPVEIEQRRSALLKDSRLLHIEDLGAGSRVRSSTTKKVKTLAKTAVKPPKYGQLLYRLIKHYQPRTIIELGTSLGITTAYLAKAAPAAEIITIEGSREIQAVARESFNQLQLHSVKSLAGNFDDVLPGILANLPTVDVGYIDGNHRLQPTLHYFEQFLSKMHNDSILIFDDIHWSAEMEEAWESVKKHPSVQCTVDIFFLGFVFFRQEFKVKQHFSIRF